MNKGYIPYGPEWEKEISKLTKKDLIEWLRNALVRITDLEQLKTKEQDSVKVKGKSIFDNCKHDWSSVHKLSTGNWVNCYLCSAWEKRD